MDSLSQEQLLGTLHELSIMFLHNLINSIGHSSFIFIVQMFNSMENQKLYQANPLSVFFKIFFLHIFLQVFGASVIDMK